MQPANMEGMSVIHRFVAGVTCTCGRVNDLLLPVAECGSEFIWHLRCGSCGTWGWFHAREEEAFARAVRETARRRGEEGGLSEEGTHQAHVQFAEGLPACACGGRFHVVQRIEEEPCLGCGVSLRGVKWPDPAMRRQAAVPRIAPCSYP